MRGIVVATGLVAAVALQLAGPRLQGRLAHLAGITPTPCATAKANAGPTATASLHPRKVAFATSSGTAPAI